MILNCANGCIHWKRWGCGHPQGPTLVAEVHGRGLVCVVVKAPDVADEIDAAFAAAWGEGDKC